ncbi:MAG: SUMF1/EgtB/PvdO family nonheme iron enzyme [Phycisphaerae bacterium]|nr:SUMF1/EgtB/PvdO family nonheme iron enzyme [Phycisphaerae bacterium]
MKLSGAAVWVCVLIATLSFRSTAEAKVVYVATTGNDTNDGLNWATAMRTVQAGLNVAVSSDQVWVATGTYIECITLKVGVALYGGFAGNETNLAQRGWLTNQTILDGNHSGSVVTAPAGATAITRIDGFTIRNGNGTQSDNYRLGGGIYCYSSSPTISNNTITNNTASLGGGIACDSSSPTISNNTITGNTATDIGNLAGDGGGISCKSGSPAISNNIIAGNTALWGGGIDCVLARPTISNNTIAGNVAVNDGGGICCSSSSPAISNNVVAFNSSGLYNVGGTPTLRNNCVYNPDGTNYSGLGVGTGDISVDPQLLAADYGEVHLKAGSPCIDTGLDSVVQPAWVDMDGQPRIQGAHVDIGADEFNGSTPPFTAKVVRVSPSGNDANDGSSWLLAKRTVQAGIDAVSTLGGEVWVKAGTYQERITLRPLAHAYGGFAGAEASRAERDFRSNATILDGQQSGSVVTAQRIASGLSTIDGFTIRNGNGTTTGSYSEGGGIYCDYASPMISNNTISGNTTTGTVGHGGGIYCYWSSSPTISNNTITGNTAIHGGGICCSSSSPTISNNTITGNTATGGNYCYGGGIYCIVSSATILNNTITGNSASKDGGGMYTSSSSPTISNNTIAGNVAVNDGGGICCSSSSPAISNNVVAFNSSGLYNVGGTPTLRNNCVYNPDGTNYSGLGVGTGDISVDPQLLAADYGEVHLKAGSPCIDTGLDSVVQPAWVDMDGQPRIQGAHVDIGADEFNGSTPPFTAKVVRVSPSGNDANDGSSWLLAKRTVQAGIDAVSTLGGEVWVKAGTYQERITLRPLAHAYGGFAGAEASRAERDFRSNATILDGQQSGSVVTAQRIASGLSTIDGFTIRNGNGTTTGSYSEGGGIYCDYASPMISNNTISGNTTTGGGGNRGAGVSCHGASPAILNNTIAGNTATGGTYFGGGGGGIYCYESSAMIVNNSIIGNTATGGPHEAGCGGGIYCYSSSPTISSNTITGNTATSTDRAGYGGGIYCANASSPAILNNTIAGNTATSTFNGRVSWGYGGGISCTNASPTISNNTITGNTATSTVGHGGGIDCYNASPAISNNTVAFNSSGLYNVGGTPTLRNNCVYNPDGTNYSGLGVGTGDISVDPLFVNRQVGDFRLLPGSPCIDAGYNAGVPAGVSKDLDGHPRFMDDPATADCPNAPGDCGAAPIVDMGAYEFVTPLDTQAPTIAITSPTSNPTYTTASSTIDLAGTALDNVGVMQVTWSNSRGGNGTAIGTASWSVTGILLQGGQNLLTLTARDEAGNSASDQLNVTYDTSWPFWPPQCFVSPAAPSTMDRVKIRFSGEWPNECYSLSGVEVSGTTFYFTVGISPGPCAQVVVPWSHTEMISPLGVGSYTVHTVLVDGFGEAVVEDNVCKFTVTLPMDSDGDGALDSVDACPNTIPGTVVDEHGCPAVIFGDFDRDGDVDADDLDAFESCATGPAIPYDLQNPPGGCTLEAVDGFLPPDHDQDADVDQIDFGAFQRCYSGMNRPAQVGCDAAAEAPAGMELISAGEFLMGDTFTEGSTEEQPVHAVYVGAFYMDRYEVTNQQYADALNWAKSQGNLITVNYNVVYKYSSSTPYCSTALSSSYSQITWDGSTFGVVAGKEDYPMVMVSWYGSVAYANWRSGMEGRPLGYDLSTWNCIWNSGYRLPTEAEWERAARGGVAGHRFPWSDNDDIQHARANYSSSTDYSYDDSPTRGDHPLWGVLPYPFTSPVGFFDGSMRSRADFGWPGIPTSYQTSNGASNYNLYDMAGSVWEWCNDWYSATYYEWCVDSCGTPCVNPRGPETGQTSPVLRGGCWECDASRCRVAARGGVGGRNVRSRSIGFRLTLNSE